MRYTLFVFFMLCGFRSQCQDSLTLKISVVPRDKQLSDVLEFQGIQQEELFIISPSMKGKTINLSYEVIAEGVVTEKGTLTGGAPDMLLRIPDDTFKLKVLCQAIADSGKFCFYFPRFTTRNFFNLTKSSGDYNMRFALRTDRGNMVKIPITADRQPIFVYSLPFQTPDPKMQSYCELTVRGVPPAKWWEVYHVKHYIVFYMQIK